ncbi:TRAP transporter small permease [Escherichia sp. E4385]|uniref:TRAP transporter small permease n=1 Tax=Escherichia sp. E4385 TaxID=2040639 RepID=UPI0010FDFE38|nr:TRAP transporter small permease [Escherichia sp. E4385]TLI96426.1 TRAP transporter small permease [Escherichia sp. E4385]
MLSVLKKLNDFFYAFMDFILVACMVVMFLLIFINVMMRFIFNDSIDIAEELPRFLFVWMTFIGAVIALREKTHINVNIITARLSLLGKMTCWVICQIIIIICAGYMFYSTLLQHEILFFNLSPVMMISMIFVYGVSYISGLAMLFNAAGNLMQFFSGKITEKDIDVTL